MILDGSKISKRATRSAEQPVSKLILTYVDKQSVLTVPPLIRRL